MTNNSNKTIYLAIGVVVVIAAIPVVMGVLTFLAGFLFYLGNAN